MGITTVKFEKRQIGRAHVKYFGRKIGQGARRPLDTKVTVVQEFPKPKTKTDLRAFLGFTGYYI